jgi:hypothetical protein
MFINRANNKRKLNTEEVRWLNDIIEKEEGGDRIAKGEEEVVKLVMNEYKNLKIVNNRDSDTEKKDETSNVHYADNRSRWSHWNNLQSLPNRKKYFRVQSKPNWWRTQSGNWHQAPHRTLS